MTLIAIAIVATVTTVEARVLSFTIRADKNEFAFSEPVEVTSELRVSANSLRQPYPEGISANVVYEVEAELHGTFFPVKQTLAAHIPIWGAKVEDVTVNNTPLIGTMDLRILFSLDPGRYRVRGKYRADNRSLNFDIISGWSEFEIRPKTEREAVIFEEFERAGAGTTKTERVASYEAFAAKYPTEYITTRVYDEMLNCYYKAGDEERRLDLLKKLVNYPTVSKIRQRLYAYAIADLEEKNGQIDEAIQWYRHCPLQNCQEKIDQLQGKNQ